jgi:hypothetical protein
MNEIVVKFPSKEMMEEFLGQMMDGYGESFFDFTHWHEVITPEGQTIYGKEYDEQGRLICDCNRVGESDEEEDDSRRTF